MKEELAQILAVVKNFEIRLKKPFFPHHTSKIENFLHSLKNFFNPPPPSDAVQKQKKSILEDLFSSVLLQFKKMTPLETWNLII